MPILETEIEIELSKEFIQEQLRDLARYLESLDSGAVVNTVPLPTCALSYLESRGHVRQRSDYF
jgi:hypothetical protein